MNLECLNDIISDRLAIHIDISDIGSWNLNTGFTLNSLTQWSGAKSDNIDLLDFGLTAFDNGRTNQLYNTLQITPSDLVLNLHRVGFNNLSGGTFYTEYDITGVTTASTVGNYFELNGGYVQGFFKLQDYNYEVLPPRFGEGITIENIIRIDPNSSGIFYLMGARAEDKYNPFFSGETKLVITKESQPVPTGVVGQSSTIVTTITGFSGVTTSKQTYLNAFLDEEVRKDAFSDFANATDIVPVEQPKDSTFDNVIAFELTQDKRISLKRIDENGLVITKLSTNRITTTGWTFITLTFTPNEIITDPQELKCADRRTGILTFYVNGRKFWELNDYNEFLFSDFKNTGEKVIGVPYNISWGGGSFGLKHSWHYDSIKTTLYDGQDLAYIQGNFDSIPYPLNDDPCIPATGSSDPTIGGIAVSGTSTVFAEEDICDPNIEIPVPVMAIVYTGTTAQTPSTQYYVEYTTPVTLLSNRDYNINMDIFDTGIFQPNSKGTISLVIYGTEDIEVLSQTKYQNIITSSDTTIETPFPILCGVYEYVDGETGLLIDGQTGYPVDTEGNQDIINNAVGAVSGRGKWNTIKLKIKTKDNSGPQMFRIGLLIESDNRLIDNFVLYVDNYFYYGSETISQDSNKSNLLIEQNFDSSYIGGIQKLRIYDVAFDSQQVLHNARIESTNNPSYGVRISRGGRIINR